MSKNLEKMLPRTGETRKLDNPNFEFGTVSKTSLVGFYSKESKDILYLVADWDSICGSSNPNGYGNLDENGFMVKVHETTKFRDEAVRSYKDYRMPNGSY